MRRDAVHVAIAPIEAAEVLNPGQRVGIDGQKISATAEPHIGIVDPFLRHAVQPGELCWLVLFPNTITSLRHEWVHPALGLQEPMDDLRVAAERVANACGKTYDALMDDARQFQGSLRHSHWPDHIMDNSERYKDVGEEDWLTFWKHFERVTGEKPNADYLWAPYTCSC